MNLWGVLGVATSKFCWLVAFAETVNDMKNLTLDSYSAHKSTPSSGSETAVSIVWLIVMFGGETSQTCMPAQAMFG